MQINYSLESRHATAPLSSICALALFAALNVSGQATAAPIVELEDNYWGGNNYCPAYYGACSDPDSVGGSPFTIESALVSRDGNLLTITVLTDYAGRNGLDGTYYGDLFLNPIWAASERSQQDAHYSTDTYQPGDWSFVLHLPGAKSIATGNQSGTATFYDVAGHSEVVQESKVSNCTDSYPIDRNCGYYYRAHQAVSIDPTSLDTSTVLDANANWNIVNNQSITFTFDDRGLLGNQFALSWAMTCANDIIQGEVRLPSIGNPPPPPTIPEPSTIFLTGTGLLLGFMRRRQAV